MKIGILALQGAFIEHKHSLDALGVESFEIRQKKVIEKPFDGLIIPGGESTVIGKLLHKLDLYEPIKVTRTEELTRVDRGLLEQGEPFSGISNVVMLMPVAVLYILLCLLPFQTFCNIVQSMGIPLFLCDRILRYQHKKDGKKSI